MPPRSRTLASLSCGVGSKRVSQRDPCLPLPRPSRSALRLRDAGTGGRRWPTCAGCCDVTYDLFEDPGEISREWQDLTAESMVRP